MRMTPKDYIEIDYTFGKTCMLSFQSGGSGTQWLLGAQFMKKFHVTFDMKARRMVLAEVL